MDTFAVQLRRHRDARAMTQEELADRAGITAKAVGALERGERRRPYPHTVRGLADALELDQRDRAALVRAASPGAGVHALDRPAARLPPLALATPMIGRDAEVESVASLLLRPVRRMVTLTGPGGVGKTTLALAVAGRVQAGFPGGVVVAELADVVDPDEALATIALAVGAPLTESPVSPRALAHVLVGRRVLLVLDNAERVLAAGPELAQVIALCPNLVLLVTSRAPLRVRPEQEVRMTPLPHAAAVQLFRDRADAAGVALGHGPETVAAIDAICTRCDGLPLAVELAAAAAVVVGPTALLARLDTPTGTAPRDLPARQRSMAATFEWSLALLRAPARSLLTRLSVCRHGFSLSLAEAVGGEDPDAVLSSLTELLEHSLITRVTEVDDTDRFRLLEPVRQDAAHRLGPADRDDAHAGLTRAILETARCLADDLRGVRQPVALRLLHADRYNLREAHEQLLRAARYDDAVDLLVAVQAYLQVRGRAREGLRWVKGLQGHPMSDQSRIRWLNAWTLMSYFLADITSGRRLAAATLASAEQAGDEEAAALAAALATWGAAFSGDLPEARRLDVRAEAHGAATGEGEARLRLLLARFWTALHVGDLDGADHLTRDAEGLARGLGPYQLAVLRFTRSLATERRGAHAESASLLAESIQLSLQVESGPMMAFAVPELAAVAVRLGDPETGTRLFGAAGYYLDELDVEAPFLNQHRQAPEELSRAHTELDEATFTRAWETGRNATADEVGALAGRFVRDTRAQLSRGPGSLEPEQLPAHRSDQPVLRRLRPRGTARRPW